MLKNIADKKDNVFLLDLICFEYTLLEFNKLIDWIYAPEDEFREKRKGVITAREKLVQIINSGEMNYKAIQEIMDYDRSLQNYCLILLGIQGLRFQKGIWEYAGGRIVVSGQIDKKTISVDSRQPGFR